MSDTRPFPMDEIMPFYPGSIDESKLANVGLRLDAGRCLTTKQHKRAMAMLTRTRKATAQLKHLPGPDESLHCILNGEFALFDFIPAALELSGEPISDLTVATLGFSKNNVDALGQLVDAGQVKRVAVLCSHYFSAADSEIYAHMVELCTKHAFPIAAMRTHAKLLLMAIGSHRLVVESSANLRSCHNCEQATMFDSPTLYRFHREWIQELLEKGADNTPRPHRCKPKGYQQTRAAFGVLAAHRDQDSREAILQVKQVAGSVDRFAAEVASLVRAWSPTLPSGTAVTVPPQGASYPGAYFAERLAKATARLLDAPFIETLARTDAKAHHHPHESLKQAPYKVVRNELPRTLLVLDDLITSGTTMRLSLEALRAEMAAFGFAYGGC